MKLRVPALLRAVFSRASSLPTACISPPGWPTVARSAFAVRTHHGQTYVAYVLFLLTILSDVDVVSAQL